MSFKAILTIDGKKFNVLDANYNFTRFVDDSGFVTNLVRLKQITIVLPGLADTFFLQWMFSPTLQKYGSLSFYEDEDKIRKVKQVHFSGAFCVGFKEEFHSFLGRPMHTVLTISAGGLKISESVFRFPWFKGAFHADELPILPEVIEYLTAPSEEKPSMLQSTLVEERKQKLYSEGEIVPVNLANIEVVNFSFTEESCELQDKVSGAVFCWLTIPNSKSEGPEMTLKTKDAWLKQGNKLVKVKLDPVEKFSWTAVSLQNMLKLFEKKHGDPPEFLSGSLAWDNLRNFQKEYSIIRDSETALSEEEILRLALSKISFGQHRINKGYGKFDVKIFGSTTIVIDEVHYKNVPRNVEVIAYLTK